jgi:hypothetical protein
MRVPDSRQPQNLDFVGVVSRNASQLAERSARLVSGPSSHPLVHAAGPVRHDPLPRRAQPA